nr:hypothetical protein B0A51_03349 [Rachicladosporium sp. CCFEE 5018]
MEVQDATKSFLYDAPDSRLFRLFHLDLDNEGEALSGTLLTTRFPGTLQDQYKTFIKVNILEHGLDVMEAMTGSRDYTALSYSWGKEPGRYPLWLATVANKLDKDERPLINAGPDRSGNIWITANLRDFLLQMRRQKLNRFLWIDAICIAQHLDADKDVQIPRMRDIYELAGQVWVWLGDASSAQSECFSDLPLVNNNLGVILDGPGPKDRQALDTWLYSTFSEGYVPPPSNHFWQTISQLLSLSYWRRLWTLQELAVAENVAYSKHWGSSAYKPPNAEVLYGSHRVGWDQIEHFVSAIDRLGLSNWLKSRQGGDILEDLHAFRGLFEIRMCRLDSGWAVPLDTLLLATRRREASKPQDMVIGMLAMMDRSTIRKLALSSSMPVSQVFSIFGQYYIQHEPQECLLNHNATQVKLPGLPSWCPDFSSREITSIIGTRSFKRTAGEDDNQAVHMPCAGFNEKGKWAIPKHRLEFGRLVVNVFTAKGGDNGLYNTGNPRGLQPVECSNSIRASGMSLDVVTSVIDCNPAAEAIDFLAFNSVQQTHEWDRQCIQLARQTLPAGSSGFDIYARTITANRITTSTTISNEAWYDKEARVVVAGQYLRFQQFVQATLGARTTISPANMDADTLRFTQCLQQMSCQRRFFATKSGRIGLGSSNMQVGDELVVFFFCPTPYLLRQVKQETLFVGEAYVMGLMYGEALDMLERGEVKETQWILA